MCMRWYACHTPTRFNQSWLVRLSHSWSHIDTALVMLSCISLSHLCIYKHTRTHIHVYLTHLHANITLLTGVSTYTHAHTHTHSLSPPHPTPYTHTHSPHSTPYAHSPQLLPLSQASRCSGTRVRTSWGRPWRGTMEGASATDLQSRMGITTTCSSRADRSPPLTLTSRTHCLEAL